MNRGLSRAGIALAGAALAALAPPSRAAPPGDQPVASPSDAGPSYADLVDLAHAAPLILRGQIRKAVPLEPERSGNVRPGWARLYIEATPLARLDRGGAVAAASGVVRYLADMPRDARGRAPQPGKRIVLLFAQPAPGGEAGGQIRLVAPDAQLLDGPELESRLRTILGQLAAPDAPGAVSAVREAIYVPGELAGAGETQIFLAIGGGTPASLSVEHAPGAAPRWSASFSEVVDASGAPPAPGTLAWYRLACFLPPQLPGGVNVSETSADKAQAARDYQFVRAELGPCGRTREGALLR